MGTAADAARRARSHARIVEVAAKLVRARGVDGASVDLVMGAAGLTRGGFYAHFTDKSAMLAEALDAAFEQSRRNMFGVEERGLAWVERIAARYLAPDHVSGVASGCSVPALAAEVSRGDGAVKAAFARNVSRVLEEMAERLAEGAPVTEADRAEAALLFSTWVGALTLARALDPRQGDEVLAAAREGSTRAARSRRAARADVASPLPPERGGAAAPTARAAERPAGGPSRRRRSRGT